jgi:hypothetical protein
VHLVNPTGSESLSALRRKFTIGFPTSMARKELASDQLKLMTIFPCSHRVSYSEAFLEKNIVNQATKAAFM